MPGKSIATKWFVSTEIELNSKCNRKCEYCPISSNIIPEVPEYLEDEVFYKMIDELRRINFVGRISLHLYSEPLLVPNIEARVRQLSKALPLVKIVLFTNGDFLTDSKYEALIASGGFHIVITNHSNRFIPEREFQTVILPSQLQISNRGGSLYTIDSPRIEKCYIPSEMLIISVTGDVLLCCDDYFRKNKMGNILNQSLPEIWFSEKFESVRKLLRSKRRDIATSICRKCDNIEGTKPYSAEKYIISLVKKGRKGRDFKQWIG